MSINSRKSQIIILLRSVFFCLSILFSLTAIAVEDDHARPPAPKIMKGEIHFEINAVPPSVTIFFYPASYQGSSGNTELKLKEYRVYKDGKLVAKIDPRHINGSTYYYFEHTELQKPRGHDWTRKEIEEYSKIIKKEEHYYAVSAVDMAGNESPLSEPVYTSSFKPQYYCFAKNTAVLMADGSLKSIQDLNPGDQIAAYDIQNAQRVSAEVARITSGHATSYLIINGLKVTEHHPFAVGADQWKESKDLRVGDKVVGLNNEITIKEISKVDKDLEVFDLSVSPFSNFYVFNGDSFFLVHNKD